SRRAASRPLALPRRRTSAARRGSATKRASRGFFFPFASASLGDLGRDGFRSQMEDLVLTIGQDILRFECVPRLLDLLLRELGGGVLACARARVGSLLTVSY